MAKDVVFKLTLKADPKAGAEAEKFVKTVETAYEKAGKAQLGGKHAGRNKNPADERAKELDTLIKKEEKYHADVERVRETVARKEEERQRRRADRDIANIQRSIKAEEDKAKHDEANAERAAQQEEQRQRRSADAKIREIERTIRAEEAAAERKKRTDADELKRIVQREEKYHADLAAQKKKDSAVIENAKRAEDKRVKQEEQEYAEAITAAHERMARSFQAAAAGAIDLGKGLLQAGALGAKSSEDLLKKIVAIESAVNVTKGVIAIARNAGDALAMARRISGAAGGGGGGSGGGVGPIAGAGVAAAGRFAPTLFSRAAPALARFGPIGVGIAGIAAGGYALHKFHTDADWKSGAAGLGALMHWTTGKSASLLSMFGANEKSKFGLGTLYDVPEFAKPYAHAGTDLLREELASIASNKRLDKREKAYERFQVLQQAHRAAYAQQNEVSLAGAEQEFHLGRQLRDIEAGGNDARRSVVATRIARYQGKAGEFGQAGFAAENRAFGLRLARGRGEYVDPLAEQFAQREMQDQGEQRQEAIKRAVSFRKTQFGDERTQISDAEDRARRARGDLEAAQKRQEALQPDVVTTDPKVAAAKHEADRVAASKEVMQYALQAKQAEEDKANVIRQSQENEKQFLQSKLALEKQSLEAAKEQVKLAEQALLAARQEQRSHTRQLGRATPMQRQRLLKLTETLYSGGKLFQHQEDFIRQFGGAAEKKFIEDLEFKRGEQGEAGLREIRKTHGIEDPAEQAQKAIDDAHALMKFRAKPVGTTETGIENLEGAIVTQADQLARTLASYIKQYMMEVQKQTANELALIERDLQNISHQQGQNVR